MNYVSNPIHRKQLEKKFITDKQKVIKIQSIHNANGVSGINIKALRMADSNFQRDR